MVSPAGAVTIIYNVLAVGVTGRVTIRYAKAVKRTSHDRKCRRYLVLSCTANTMKQIALRGLAVCPTLVLMSHQKTSLPASTA